MLTSDKIYEEYKLLSSNELFGKEYKDLSDEELSILKVYIHDKLNPIWKDIIYNGIKTDYQISNTGQVRNKLNGFIRKQKTNRGGYKMINITVGKKWTTTTVHKLVANAFIPNPENKPVVNHISGIKSCNWIGNLERATYKENTQHAIKMGLAGRPGVTNPNNKFPEETIHQICKLLEQGKEATEINTIIPNSLHVASGIKRGVLWKDIASQYKIPKPVNILRPEDYKEAIKELIMAGYEEPKEILKILNKEITKSEKDYIYLFKRRFLGLAKY